MFQTGVPDTATAGLEAYTQFTANIGTTPLGDARRAPTPMAVPSSRGRINDFPTSSTSVNFRYVMSLGGVVRVLL